MQVIKGPREALLKPLTIVGGIIENHQTMNILSNVLIKKNGTDVSFTGTDLEILIRTHNSNGVDGGDPVAFTVSARKALDKAWTNKNGTLKANTPDGILGQYEALERQADALNARIAQIRLDPAGTEEAQSLAGRLGEAKERAGMLEKELAKAGRADKLEGIKAKLAAVTGHAGRAALSLAKMGAKSTVGKLGSAVGNVAGKIKGFAGGLAKAFGQVLKYRTACAVFESLSETMLGVAKSDSVLNANLGKIQGNLLTAFAPVINAILPMLRTLSSAIATVTAQFASMMAALFGTTVQAAASTASKVNAAATGASSKLKRSVMSFDKLNKVDIVGFLYKKGGLTREDVGQVDVKEHYAFVAVRRSKVKQLLTLVRGEKIKGMKTIIEEAK
mgnify:CR=1 FL=1